MPYDAQKASALTKIEINKIPNKSVNAQDAPAEPHINETFIQKSQMPQDAQKASALTKIEIKISNKGVNAQDAPEEPQH